MRPENVVLSSFVRRDVPMGVIVDQGHRVNQMTSLKGVFRLALLMTGNLRQAYALLSNLCELILIL